MNRNSYKDLYNIPKDLEELTKGNTPISTEATKELGGKIAEVVSSFFVKRSNSKSDALRLSAIGKPLRQLWLTHNHSEVKKDLTLDRFMTFLAGAVMEEVLLWMVQQTGKYEVTDQQAEVDVEGIKGHIDCKINGIPVDVKTAAKGSFDKFVTGGLFDNDPYGYIPQLSSYTEGEDPEKVDGAAFLVYGKEDGRIAIMGLPRDKMVDPKERVEVVKATVTSPSPPEEYCYELKELKNGNVKVPNQCVWCSFFEHCYKDKGVRAFDYASGPEYLAEVNKTPRVRELEPFTLKPVIAKTEGGVYPLSEEVAFERVDN